MLLSLVKSRSVGRFLGASIEYLSNTFLNATLGLSERTASLGPKPMHWRPASNLWAVFTLVLMLANNTNQ